MTTRRSLLSYAVLASAASVSACAGAGAQPASTSARSVSLLDLYVALKNAHDASRCGEIFSDTYVEHSGRSPNGLLALIANWKAQFDSIPDIRLTLDDRIVAGDKFIARFTYSGTHAKPLLGIPPTGKTLSWGTIDIWRVAEGKLAEHWDQVDFAGLARQLAAK